MNLKKEFVFSIITSLVGSLIIFLISYVCKNSDTITITVYVIILVLTAIIINFQQPLVYIFSSPGGWVLNKNWISHWGYNKNGNKVEIEDKIELKQIGSYIKGIGISTQISGDFSFKSTKYIIRGNINREGVINGTWKNINNGRNYYGTLILICKRDGLLLEGKWSGISNGGVNAGDWLWKVDNSIKED